MTLKKLAGSQRFLDADSHRSSQIKISGNPRKSASGKFCCSYVLRHAITLSLCLCSFAFARQLEPFGLQGKTVVAMTYYGGSLYAATQNDGVYRRYLGELDSGWVHLGVPAKNLTSIFAFHTVCPLKCWKGVLVGATLHPAQNDSALIYYYQQRPDSCVQKGNWAVSDSGIPRATAMQITALGGIDVCHPIAPTYVTAFAATPGAIWRSEDRGKNWKTVWRDSTANILTLTAGSKQLFFSTDDEIWAGGYSVNNTGVKYPLVLRSTDAGLNWENRTPPAIVSDECRALALHPTDTSLVYAAFTSSLLQSNDAGKTWRATNFTETAVSFRALALNPQQPAHLVASGMMPHLGVARIYESTDAGANWREVLPSSALGFANGLAFDPADQRHVYIATAQTGVFRYPHLTVGVENEQNAPKSFQLVAHFPNPFNSNDNAMLTFHLNLPAADDVAFRLFNISGQEIGVWKFALTAGVQNLTLPVARTKLAAGLYFIQAEWRGQRITQKWTFIR